MHDTKQLSWTDGIDSCRCRVSKSVPRFVLIPAGLAGLLGLFVGSLPFLMSALFFFVTPREAQADELFKWFALSPLVFVGMFTFPFSALVIRWSVLVLFGQTHILLDGSKLRVVTSAGPIWSTRRCPLSQLGGFRIATAAVSRSSPAFASLGERSNLVAVRKNGREVVLLRVYPDAIIQQLAEELPARIERLTGRVVQAGMESIRATDLGLETVAMHPQEVLDRVDKPIGSRLVFEDQGEGFVIRAPRLGFRKSTSKAFAVWSMGFLLMQFGLTVTLVPALLAGKVGGQPAAGWVIFAVFTMISIGIVLSRFSAAIRKGSICVNRQSLQLTDSGLFGTQRAEWDLATIEEVRVGVEKYESEDGASWDHFVQVRPDAETSRQWFDHLEKSELEWIVTQIRTRLSGQTTDA
ncbi:MAG: hypothetical protein CL681_17745 [Blastopirellula sp.]|nr:hypothetical protein [Blastopirellula sp.]